MLCNDQMDPWRQARARWGWLLSALALVPGCVPEDEMADVSPVNAVPTFEEFQASVPRFEDSWTVEGDIAIHSLEALRAYYDEHVVSTSGNLGTAEQPLITEHGGTNVNGINLVPSPQRHNMTYCVSSSSFGTAYNEVVAAMNAAASAWEKVLLINFIHESSQDGNCTSSNNNVWFNVRQVSGASFGARAFFPDDPRSQRELLIDASYLGDLGDGVLRHELGHILGFRHEFNHDDYPGSSCTESGSFHQPVPYDSGSVMAYPSWASCGGSNPDGYDITRLDKIGSQEYYGPPADRCSVIDTDNCWTRDAWCEATYSVTGARSDLCRWTNVSTKSACEAPQRRGIWTTAASGFDTTWPTALPDGASAACITQVNNVSCSLADEAECALYGASCERAYHIDGHRHDLCRWYADTTPAQCEWPGIWTAEGSGFDQVWPTAVGLYPAGKAGACITQIANLP